MHFSSLAAATAAIAVAEAGYVGFNYASTFEDGTAKAQSDFETDFKRAADLQGTNGDFTSARLYTMIQADTTDTPISAIPAAIDTSTYLLLGLWASSGQSDIDNEITALMSAIEQYGTDFTSLIQGISVGSEDLYRNSPTGIETFGYNAGAQPDQIVSYIEQVKGNISSTSASAAPVGHVDTWTAWVNTTNAAVITACDWLGMDAYPYFQYVDIDVANATFYEAYYNTTGVAGGKEVWVTETGWPVTGPTEEEAVASTANAEIYWQDVECSLLEAGINFWWYILQDYGTSPSFGVVGEDIASAPLYNLTCSNGATVKTATSSTSSATASATASSATKPASAVGTSTQSLSVAVPGAETTSKATGTAASGSAATATGASGSAVPYPYTNGTAPVAASGTGAASASGQGSASSTGSASSGEYTGAASHYSAAGAGVLALAGLIAAL